MAKKIATGCLKQVYSPYGCPYATENKEKSFDMRQRRQTMVIAVLLILSYYIEIIGQQKTNQRRNQQLPSKLVY